MKRKGYHPGLGKRLPDVVKFGLLLCRASMQALAPVCVFESVPSPCRLLCKDFTCQRANALVSENAFSLQVPALPTKQHPPWRRKCAKATSSSPFTPDTLQTSSVVSRTTNSLTNLFARGAPALDLRDKPCVVDQICGHHQCWQAARRDPRPQWPSERRVRQRPVRTSCQVRL